MQYRPLRKDPKRNLAFAHAPAELQPRVEPGDPCRHDPPLVALPSQQGAIASRVIVKHRPGPNPASPSLRRQQLLGSVPQALAVLAATLGTLLLGQHAR
jgi:hypothetical protein